MDSVSFLLPAAAPGALCPGQFWPLLAAQPKAELIICGSLTPPPNGRIRSVRAEGSRADLINAGLDVATGDSIVMLGDGDLLDAECLTRAMKRAAQADVAGVVSAFRFTTPIGELPVREPLPSTGETLGLEELLILRPVPSAALIRREAIGAMRCRSDLGSGAELDLIFRVSQSAPFARIDAPLVHRAMSPLADVNTTLADLAAHVRLLADFVPPSELAGAASDLIDAVVVLRVHQRAITERGPTHLAPLTRFPSLFAQWWHRCGLFGQAPRHVLEANGGIEEAVTADPALIASRIVSMCPRSKPPVLLGLGRNARVIARALHAAGRQVLGRDDSLSGPPTWAKEDGIPVRVIASTEPFDTAATHIMTVLHDDAFVSRLPSGLRMIRWRTVPELIMAEWRTAALDWALRASLAEPKPALAGASA